MRIAHLSDFHFTKLTLNPLRLFSKRFFGQLNWLIHRKKEFCQNKLDLLPELFKSLNVDLIILGGDFTSTSLPQEFAKAKMWVSKLPARYIAIPGNHDLYTKKSLQEQRYFQYFDTLHPVAIGENWWVIPINTCCPNPIRSARGIFSESDAQKLESQLSQIQGNVIILNHYPFFQQEGPNRSLHGGAELEKILRKYPQIKLYLHGHTHRHSIADLRADHLPIVLDSGSCSLQRGSWNLIDLTIDACLITPYSWTGIWQPKEKKEFLWNK